MEITALAPWFGSKRTLAPAIVREFGDHRAYWEPFCGSMAVLLAKPRCSMETVNDLHGDLVNLARTIRDRTRGVELYRRLRRALVCQQFLEDSRRRLQALEFVPAADPDVDRAEAYFLNSWLSMNGTAGTRAGMDGRRGISRRFSSAGGAPAIRFAAAVDSIPAWRERLRRVMILNDNGLELCDRIEDRRGTVIYADPPYIEKGEEYVHDFASEDHQRLAEVLCRFRETRVLVSYYDDPHLEVMYPGWTKRELRATKIMANQSRRDKTGATAAPEVLMINGPSLNHRELF